MDMALQVKLLKLLEEKQLRAARQHPGPEGQCAHRGGDHQPLEQLVSEGGSVPISSSACASSNSAVPALRERGDDVVLLARHFLAVQSARYNKAGLAFSPAVAEKALTAPHLARQRAGIAQRRRAKLFSWLLINIEPDQLPFCAVLGRRSDAPADPVLSGLAVGGPRPGQNATCCKRRWSKPAARHRGRPSSEFSGIRCVIAMEKHGLMR